MLEVVAHNSPDGVTLPAWQERTGPVTLPGLPDPAATTEKCGARPLP